MIVNNTALCYANTLLANKNTVTVKEDMEELIMINRYPLQKKRKEMLSVVKDQFRKALRRSVASNAKSRLSNSNIKTQSALFRRFLRFIQQDIPSRKKRF